MIFTSTGLVLALNNIWASLEKMKLLSGRMIVTQRHPESGKNLKVQKVMHTPQRPEQCETSTRMIVLVRATRFNQIFYLILRSQTGRVPLLYRNPPSDFVVVSPPGATGFSHELPTRPVCAFVLQQAERYQGSLLK